MGVKKKEKAAAGAPAWMVTYGDMVTLLLTFFVLLLAMSEIKQDQRMIDFMQAVKEAFGYDGGVRQLPTETVQIPKNVDQMKVLIVPIYPRYLGHTTDEGPRGKKERVDTRPPGEYYQPGARFRFPELSATLDQAEIQRVVEYAEQLRGITTVIEVWGRCSKRPVDGTPFLDHIDLSFQRARAVARVLTDNGINERRIRIGALGTSQPITRSSADAGERQRNDIVELLQIDQTVTEFQP